MKKNILICGVGGQGVLTIAKIIVMAAQSQGIKFKQNEVHGMSQRGGSVYVHLRLSDSEIFSPIIPKGKADIVLALEPMEALRYAPFLSREGLFVSSSAQLKNIEYDYGKTIEKIRELGGKLLDSKKLAEKAGNALTENVVLLGAISKKLGFKENTLRKALIKAFGSKEKSILSTNLKAFELGKNALL